MRHIFISYSRDDHDRAHRLAAQMEAHGFTVWLDDGRRSYRDISQALRQCGAVVALLTVDGPMPGRIAGEVRVAKMLGKPVIEADEGGLDDDFFAELAQLAPGAVGIGGGGAITLADIADDAREMLGRVLSEFIGSGKMFGPSWAIGLVRVWPQNLPGQGNQVIACVLIEDVAADDWMVLYNDGWTTSGQQVIKRWPLTLDPDLPATIAEALVKLNERLGLNADDIKIERR